MFELWMQTGSWRSLLGTVFGIALFATAVFIILLVLVQRGRGGGLAGAFGGMGGQSAFGAKAGDTFTKITIYASTFWILLCMAALVLLNPPARKVDAPDGVSDPLTGAATESTTGGAATEDAATDDGAIDNGATDNSDEGGETDDSGDATTTTGGDTEGTQPDADGAETTPPPPTTDPGETTDDPPPVPDDAQRTP